MEPMVLTSTPEDFLRSESFWKARGLHNALCILCNQPLSAEYGPESKRSEIPALPFGNNMILGKGLNFSEFYMPYLYNGENNAL